MHGPDGDGDEVWHPVHCSATQLPEKNGLEEVAAIVPLKPASHVQPVGTSSVPVESAGQAAAARHKHA